MVLGISVAALPNVAGDLVDRNPRWRQMVRWTKTVQTQVTVQDGDTIAIAGIINETESTSSVGIPLLNRIPILGLAFGQKSLTKARTELILFITPRVIYDSNQLADASDELKVKVRSLQKMMKQQ